MGINTDIGDGSARVIRISLGAVGGFVVTLVAAFGLDHGGSVLRAMIYSTFIGGVAAGVGARETPRYGFAAGLLSGSLVWIALQATVLSIIHSSPTTHASGAGLGIALIVVFSVVGGLLAPVLASFGGLVGSMLYLVGASIYTEGSVSERR